MGRLMGIDHGEARIGVALSDPFRLFAQPHSIIATTTRQADIAALCALVESEQVIKIVVGLPTAPDGGVGQQALIVIRWARDLAAAVPVPVVFWDESYSSVEAEALRGGRRRRKRGRAQPVDDLAAAAILQEYLDVGGADHEPGQPLATYADIE
jgi:putative Holliday junction resolvase